MAKKTFNPAEDTQETPVQTNEAPTSTSTAVVPRADRAPSTFVNNEEAQGEFDRDDVEKSYLTIVANTGELANLFTSGDLLINKEFVIGGKKSPVEVIAMGIRKRYQNDLDFESSDEAGATVDTAVEVVNLGGVVGYRPHGDKVSTHFYKKILQVMLLIKRPEDISPDAAAMFPFDIDGSDYAVVGYTARTKSAYNGIAKPLVLAVSSKGTVRSQVYRLSTKGESWEGKSWIQPSLRVAGKTSDAVLAFINGYNK